MNRSLRSAVRRLVLVGVALVAGTSALAQPSSQSTSDSPLADRPNGPRHAQPDRFAVVGGMIHAKPGEDAFEGTVYIEHGRITLVDRAGGEPPAGFAIIDASGLHVYPGFVEAYYEVDTPSPGTPGSPGVHWSSLVTPQRSALDAEWLDSGSREGLRKLGFGAVGISPGSGILRGSNAVISLSEPEGDASGHRPMVLRDNVGQVLAFESSGWGSRAYPTSQMGSIALVRQTLLDARWQADQDGTTPNALTPLEDGDVALWFDVPGELEALRGISMAREFDRSVVIVGSGTEYQRLDAFKQDAEDGELTLVVPLRFPKAPRVKSLADTEAIDLNTLMEWEQAPTNPRRLQEAGLDIVLTSSKVPSGIGGRGGFYKLLRKAIEHGLSEGDALAALTTRPAELLGVSDHVGTIEPDKLGNLIVATEPIFDEKSKILDVWVEGKRYEINQPKAESLEGTWELTLAGQFRLDLTIDDKGKGTITDPAFEAVEPAEGEEAEGAAEGEEPPSAKATVERSLDTLTVLFDHEPFGMEGVFTLTGTVSGDEIVGAGARPDGVAFEFAGQRLERDEAEEADDDKKNEDNDEQLPPEDLGGYPFGAYSVAEIPEQGGVVITNATIWTASDRGIIENGWIAFSGGKIDAIGQGMVPNRRGATVIDARGKHVTPGLIDAHSHTGTWTAGTNESGQAVTAEVRMGDTTDPNPVNWYRQLAGGVTTVNTLHGSANPIGGQNVIQKVRWGAVHPTDMHLEGAKPGIKFALGENVKQSNWGSNFTGRYPQTRMGVETLIRDRFVAAREYADNGMKTENGRTDTELEALAEILAGDRLIHCHSYRQDEILMLCRVAEEFGFKIGTFQHGLECYKVAEAVKENAIGASIFTDWWAYKVEVQDAIPYAGPILHEAGVNVSFNSDSDELARRMNVEAAKAVKYGGLTPGEAIKFVTINPAIQLAIEERVGSLEAGKDADVVIWSGDPLSTMSRAERVFVDGREYFSLERDRAHRERIASERERLIQKLMREQAKLPEKKDDPEDTDEGDDTEEADDPGRRGVYAWFYGHDGQEGAGASMCGTCGVMPAEYVEMMEQEAR
ncbi:MAG: amidohydrolase family protein [Phycisphaera sp.]|nr:MAG: amidohydrolase family protein [Phycisphaera sp.]